MLVLFGGPGPWESAETMSHMSAPSDGLEKGLGAILTSEVQPSRGPLPDPSGAEPRGGT